MDKFSRSIMEAMAKISTDKPIGVRIADVGAGGKEKNVKTDKAWDEHPDRVHDDDTPRNRRAFRRAEMGEAVSDACCKEPPLPTGALNSTASTENAKIKKAQSKDDPQEKLKIKEEVVDEAAKLPDWAQAEFDSAFPKKKTKTHPDDDPISSFNPAIDGKYKIQKFAKGRVVHGARGNSFDPGAERVEPDAPTAPSFNADNHPWTPKPIAPKVAAAKTVTRGVTGQKAGKQVSAERRAAVQARAAKMKDPAQKAKLLKSIGEEVEQIDELSKDTLKNYVQKAHFDGGMTDYKLGKLRGSGKSALDDRHALVVKSEKRSKGIDVALGKLTKEEVDPVEFDLQIIKENSMYKYEITFADQHVAAGAAATEKAAYTQANRIMDRIVENAQNIPDPLEPQEVLEIAKRICNK